MYVPEKSAIAMQRRVASFNAATGVPVVLKVGLHEGPCIAVNLNDRTLSSAIRDLFGLLNDLLQRFDWGL